MPAARTGAGAGRVGAEPLICLLVVGLLTAWRLWVLFDHAPPLSFDEAQYWAWSLAPAFGYYSKPPMVAWAITLTTGLCGDGEGCIKLGSTLAHGITALLVYAIATELYGRRVGLWAAISFATLPAVSLSAMVISTDPFLLLFWAAALHAYLRARSGGLRWWLVTGLWLGLGLLSKYSMVLFALSALLELWWNGRLRAAARGGVAAAAVAALIYAPNLAWNALHGFASYRHTADNANLGGPLLHPLALVEFLAGQFAVFGPILFGGLVVILWRPRLLLRDERARLLLAFTLPMLGLITVQALLSRAHANWAAPAYVAATVLVVAWLIERGRFGVARLSLALHLVAAAALYNYDTILSTAGLTAARHDVLLRRVRGWDAMGQQISAVWARHPGTTLMADERKILASLLYYVRPHPLDAVKWNPSGQVKDHYDLTTDLTAVRGDVLLVTARDDASHLGAAFDRIEPVAVLAVPAWADRARTLRLYRLSGFRGYR